MAERIVGDAEPHCVVRHMGLTHAEFMRSLPAAAMGMDLRIEGPRILIESSVGRIEIRLGCETSRRLGSLVLPQTEVGLSFEGFSTEERARFMSRFDLAFQRGGG